MAYTQSQIDTLKAAIARGVVKVKYRDEEVEYRSIDEMQRTLSMMEAEVAGTAVGAMKVVYPTTDRGL